MNPLSRSNPIADRPTAHHIKLLLAARAAAALPLGAQLLPSFELVDAAGRPRLHPRAAGGGSAEGGLSGRAAARVAVRPAAGIVVGVGAAVTARGWDVALRWRQVAEGLVCQPLPGFDDRQVSSSNALTCSSNALARSSNALADGRLRRPAQFFGRVALLTVRNWRERQAYEQTAAGKAEKKQVRTADCALSCL